MSNSPKKVLVRRFSGDTLPGYLPQSAFVRHNSIDLLDLSGRLISLSLNDIKTISYVRDFNLSDPVNPERLTRRAFLARPRTEGLWLRLTFRSGDLLEGLAPTDRSLLDALADDSVIFIQGAEVRELRKRGIQNGEQILAALNNAKETERQLQEAVDMIKQFRDALSSVEGGG